MIDNMFLLSNLMGVGGSSKVYSAKWSDETEYALKIIRKDKGYSDAISQQLVLNEFMVTKELGFHPNLVNIFRWNTNGTAVLADGVHDIRYLVMEKCKNGSLSTIIRHTGPLEEEITKFLFYQLCCATQFIHEKNYAHLDIKLENILLDDYFNIKLADLGTAIKIEETLGYTNKRRGTPKYMAPEIVSKERDEMIDATLADVYSLGVWLHLLLTGEFPWEDTFGSDESSVETEISGNVEVAESNKRVKERIQFLSGNARDLLEEMLEQSAFFRVSLDEVLQHPWFTEAKIEGIQNSVYEEMNTRTQFINNNLKTVKGN